MNNISEYIAPIVNRERRMRPIWKSFISTWAILVHGLVPHEKVKEAAKAIKGTSIKGSDEKVSELILELYKESRERISDIEEKSFKLLTYISAVSAISVYFLSTDISGLYKVSVIVSLIFLVLAIIISLRSIGVKGQKALFIDGIFDFETGNEPKTKDKNEILAHLIDCAIYNQGVADNTADILRASRIMLSLGIFSTAIACIFFLSKPPEKNKIYEVRLSNSEMLKNTANRFEILADSSVKPNQTILKIEKRRDSLNMMRTGTP